MKNLPENFPKVNQNPSLPSDLPLFSPFSDRSACEGQGGCGAPGEVTSPGRPALARSYDCLYGGDDSTKTIAELAAKPPEPPQAATYLVTEGLQSSTSDNNQQNRVTMAVTKVKCNSSWCEDCFNGKPATRVSKRLSSMNPSHVRHVIVTVDRDRYGSAEEAFKAITDRKAIPDMIRNLKRICGKEIMRWLWVLEWHRDGFPHWHIFLEMRTGGRGSMIGHDLILKYWGEGHVHESYVKNRKHWHELCGYMNKTGYLSKDKDCHQAHLPEWALEWTRQIRRTDGSRGDWDEEKRQTVKRHQSEVCHKSRRQYGLILEDCGQKTRVRYITPDCHTLMTWVVGVPFSEAREVANHFGFAFLPGVGLVKWGPRECLDEIWEYFRSFPLVMGFSNGDEGIRGQSMNR